MSVNYLTLVTGIVAMLVSFSSMWNYYPQVRTSVGPFRLCGGECSLTPNANVKINVIRTMLVIGLTLLLAGAFSSHTVSVPFFASLALSAAIIMWWYVTVDAIAKPVGFFDGAELQRGFWAMVTIAVVTMVNAVIHIWIKSDSDSPTN